MNKKKWCNIFICTIVFGFVAALFCVSVSAENENVVYLRDGGNGDGTSYENALGDAAFGYSHNRASVDFYHFMDNERTLVALRYLGRRCYTVGNCGIDLLF